MFSNLLSTPALPVALLAFLTSFTQGLPYEARDPASSNSLRILPFGDSITWGVEPGVDGGTNGYRKQLRDRLAGASFSVDFVGTQTSGNMVDNQNEGWPGKTIANITNPSKLDPAMAFKPNVVTLHIGTNDLNNKESPETPYADAPERLGTLIDDILNDLSDVVLLVAKIIHSKKADTDARIATYNAAIPGVVKERADKGSKVLVVDMSVVQASELGDDLHPTVAGYSHMGNVWFDAVQAAAKQGLISPRA